MLILSIKLSGITGRISVESLASLPEHLANLFHKSARDVHKTSGCVHCRFDSREAADSVQKPISNFYKNKNRYNNRRYDLFQKSHGTYERSDIEKIFSIQEGRCYYSGRPLTSAPKNYSVDHIIPITNGGSSWPENLALCLRELNNKKKDKSKRWLIAQLRSKFGKDWARRQTVTRSNIDKNRNILDKERKSKIAKEISSMERKLCLEFPKVAISYRLDNGILILCVNNSQIVFPPGFIRDKMKFKSYNHIRDLVYDGVRLDLS